MNKITKIAEEIGYNNISLLPLLFNGINLVKGADVKIVNALKDIMDNLPLEISHKFTTTPDLKDQFQHHDCYMIADYLLYQLHDNDGIKASFVHVIKFVSAHGAVKVDYNGRTFFIDSVGVHNTIEAVLATYELTTDDVEVRYYSGEDVIDECDNEQIGKLCDLTQTRHLLQRVNDDLDMGGFGDLEDAVVENVIMALLSLD